MALLVFGHGCDWKGFSPNVVIPQMPHPRVSSNYVAILGTSTDPNFGSFGGLLRLNGAGLNFGPCDGSPRPIALGLNFGKSKTNQCFGPSNGLAGQTSTGHNFGLAGLAANCVAFEVSPGHG
ncbi:hypothetical protein GOBAR_DD03210 [Gossypium barbadense]|nr:hypothetical protein GOBAR_DD03210 [Gossypium barbadense]